MANDNKNPEKRKGFPGGFWLFLLVALVVYFTMSSISNEKHGKVSFSHQVEHLVNLDLIHKDQSKKTAINDKLVTFSGQFKAQLTDDANARYRFLELLNQNHELTQAKTNLANDLDSLRANVLEAGDFYLHLTGQQVPKGGFVIVDSVYNTPERQNGIVLEQLSNRSILSLSAVLQSYDQVSKNPTPSDAQLLGRDIQTLIVGFRSPSLGIGSEPIKAGLKELEAKVQMAAKQTPEEQLAVYKDTLAELTGISKKLAEEKQGVRLLPLRSVRNYVEDLNQYSSVIEGLDQNSAKLDQARTKVADVIWFFNNQELSTKALERQDTESYSQWFAGAKKEYEAFASNRGTPFRAPDQPRNKALDKTFQSEQPSPNYFSYFITFLPILLGLFILWIIFARQMKGGASGAMTFGKSNARMLSREDIKVTFKDVAGCAEAKEELEEIVEFLRDPGKFTALGARIPKGVLCVGSPGTGKTLVAKAVAGEADCPFFYIAGSDFVEMFVGVGASRIRDLFDQAKKHAPCIIFIDEIDAVGRQRGSGIGGGHDEREQTLNQLLVEMDGFSTKEGIILIAATNRPDILDKALMRPGRFDRRVVLELPDLKGRLAILKVHARKIKLAPDVDLMALARVTPGASGADLENILNESALIAARKNKTAVTDADAREACDKVRYGKERRSMEIDEREKKLTAIHESGHAVVALALNSSDPVDKVTIIPRGMSLGATHFMPKKNRVNYWKKELIDQLAVLMGGRVAEELFAGDISSGAQMDIQQATGLARNMVCRWGMDDELGLVAYEEQSD
ncbi:MAG TPA: ATP-dependent zinc metalloprotease FtsH, partial [Chlamydiales bacterium]|nr:ATP-dependent zinc metalloprotease FtsH [Chlamydiales bacterium]